MGLIAARSAGGSEGGDGDEIDSGCEMASTSIPSSL